MPINFMMKVRIAIEKKVPKMERKNTLKVKSQSITVLILHSVSSIFYPLSFTFYYRACQLKTIFD